MKLMLYMYHLKAFRLLKHESVIRRWQGAQLKNSPNSASNLKKILTLILL